jgi:hypothetical protein
MRMADDRRPEDATLLDLLADGFEKNEVLHGFHWRVLPMIDEAAAARKFTSLSDEARRWKGPPLRDEEHRGRRLSAWSDLEVRQAGRGVMVRIQAPRFHDWWHKQLTWAGDPLQQIYEWLEEE